MSRMATGVLFVLLLVVSIPALILHVNADEPASMMPSPSRRVEPKCVSTAEVVADGPGGTELRLMFEAEPDLFEGVPAAPSAAERVRASYRLADDAGAPLEEGTWRAASIAPGSYSVMVRVPDQGAIAARVLGYELASPDGTPVAAPDGLDLADCVRVSAPSIMRDLRLVTVTFDPLLDEPPLDAIVRSVSVAVEATGAPGINEKTSRTLHPSPAFDRLYRSEVINYNAEPAAYVVAAGRAGEKDAASGDGSRGARVPGARYLIVASDSMATALEPLIEWKELKGIPTHLASLETIGASPTDIKAYVRNAYETWDMPPEFLLLVGDTEVLPAHFDTVANDNYYVRLEGNDVFPEILVGRFSVDLVNQCEIMVAKTLFYERTPYEDDPNWPASGSLCQRDDNDDGDWIYYMDTWFVYDLMTDAGFPVIDTLFAKYGIGYEEVVNSWNAGKGFIHYRGQAMFYWITPFGMPIHHDAGIRNGNRLSIIISPTCGTGAYAADGFMSEDWTRGLTGGDPHGAVAFFGTSTAFDGSEKLSLKRSAVDHGFFNNAFGPGGLTIGEACISGKLQLYQTFQDTNEYDGWNLLGDPELNMWTAVPSHATVLHNPAVLVAEPDLTVTVLNGAAPVEGALVSCIKGDEVYSSGYTGEFGHVALPLTLATPGTLSVTVTARNCYPYEGSALVIESGPFVAFSDMAFDDSAGGNDDGLLSPGESTIIELELLNAGDVVAESVVAIFRTSDPYVTVPDTVLAFGSIPPGGTAWSLNDINLSVDAGCPRGHVVPYSLKLYYGVDSGVLHPAPIEIVTGELSFVDVAFDDAPPGGDGDGVPESGEVVELTVSLTNDGRCDLGAVTGTLSTGDGFVAATLGTAPFGDVSVAGTCDNEDDALLISVSPAAPDGHVATMSLAVDADGHSYAFADTLTFDIALTNLTSMGPTGPDDYGYYAYDSMDTIYAAAPEYDWVDIAPPGPGTLIAEITDEDAAIVTMGTMFNVKYYDTVYNQVSINSNGFISMGLSDYRFGDNTGIPYSMGPENMLAPFWDDLDPSAGGEIYHWFDIVGHRWVYQFDEVLRWGTGQAETFQVIILNEAFFPTPTGDAMIMFQYETVNNPTSCTIGIEGHNQSDGIQYLYDGAYEQQTLPVDGGMAILFTTIPPDDPNIPWLLLDDCVIDDSSGGNGDGVVQPGETVSLTLDVRNAGGRDAIGPSVVLSSDESTVSVTDGTAAMEDVLAGGSAQNTDALVCTFSETIDDTVATLWAQFEANGGAYTTTARLDVHIDLSDTGVHDGEVPTVFSLSPCHPNPFRQGATMSLALPAPERVSVKVYDPAGRLVQTLVDGRLPAGEHGFVWDGTDGSGRRVASGVYFVRAEAGRRDDSRKVVFLK